MLDQPKIVYGMVSIGDELRNRRRELGYTQMDVARLCGFSQRLISEIERGRETVAINKVMLYAQGLGIDFALLGRG